MRNLSTASAQRAWTQPLSPCADSWLQTCSVGDGAMPESLPSISCVVSMIQCYNPEEKKSQFYIPIFCCCWYSCSNSHHFRHLLNAALESLSGVCTAVTSNFTITGGLLEVKFLTGPRWETHIMCYRKRQKLPYIPLYGVFSSLHNASLLSFLATRVHHKLWYFSSHASREQRGQEWKPSGGF